MSNKTYTGIIKWFNVEKNFGFIIPEVGGKDVFLHGSGFGQGLDTTTVVNGQLITYQVGRSNGRPCACNVCPAVTADSLDGATVVGIVTFFKWENKADPTNLYGFVAVEGLQEEVFLRLTDLDGLQPEQAVLVGKGTWLQFTLERCSYKGKPSWRVRNLSLLSNTVVSLRQRVQTTK